MDGNDTESAFEADDAPELTDEWFQRATLMEGEKVIRRGRPAGGDKVHTRIWLDKAVVDYFKAGGPGWQTRINEVLRKAAGL